MNRIFVAISPQWKRLLRFVGWAALIVLLLASLPFLFDLMNRGIGWIIGLFPRPDDLWKECSWCF